MLHDPGGRSLFLMQPGTSGAAYLTPDEVHRLWLARIWGPGARYVAIAGLNPSTARPDLDDPTIRRDIGFAQRLGYAGLFKINALTRRCTDPAKLGTVDLVHPENAHILRKVGARCSMVILAYGAAAPSLTPHIAEMLRILREVKSELWCFGLTKAGYPRHTLYLRGDAKLVRFE